MKVLYINSCYEYGSTGSIVKNLRDFLENKNVETVVIYGRGKKSGDKHTYKTANDFLCKVKHYFDKLTGVCYSGEFISTRRVLSLIRKENPDIIHIHCTNDYFLNNKCFFKYLKTTTFKIVITLHADFLFTGNCSSTLNCTNWINGCFRCPNYKKATGSIFIDRTHKNWLNMRKNFLGFQKNNLYFVCVSKALYDKAIMSPWISLYDVSIILNGIKTDIFYYQNNNFFHQSLEGYKKILFSVPNFQLYGDTIKGCDIFLNIVKLCKDKSIKFIVIGDNRYNFDFSKYDNIIYLGKIIDKNELRKIYSSVDMTLLTSREETFSLVTAESLCCGTKVFGYKAKGPESITLPKYSSFISQCTNIESFVDEMIKFLNTSMDKNEISALAKMKYNFNDTAMQYLKLYYRILSKYEN